MVNISDIKYIMDMGCGSDYWRILGYAENHPTNGTGEVFVSTPVSFDKEKKQFTTYSGREYQITSFGMPEEKFWEQMEKDISNQGFEVH